ncbi:hypothetical protein KIN20_005762 [Parelaphostrongylus tenuis]|uniref:Uncharacterized protein n=1 Tax=Parelaphostrongylus tenuis TaxID=148309 RepID=A0AAD5M0V0_PARTN|nr:hypothetical protein KIN20_005762 [Parelaphostrongylus tenuis]
MAKRQDPKVFPYGECRRKWQSRVGDVPGINDNGMSSFERVRRGNERSKDQRRADEENNKLSEPQIIGVVSVYTSSSPYHRNFVSHSYITLNKRLE